MHQGFFSIKLRRYTTLGFLFIMAFFAFAMGAAASDRCPGSSDHGLAPLKYQLFTAYQTAYDGYQAPCELKCFDKAECTKMCQTKKGLQSLNKAFKEQLSNKKLRRCQSLSNVCISQCSASDQECQSACT